MVVFTSKYYAELLLVASVKQFLHCQIFFNHLLLIGISTVMCKVKMLQLLQYLYWKNNNNHCTESDSPVVCDMFLCKKQVMGISLERQFFTIQEVRNLE